MNPFSSSLKLSAALLFFVAATGHNGLAKPQDAPRKAPVKATPTIAPKPLAKPLATPTETPKPVQAVVPEPKALSLLEIFPVQEPLSYRDGKSATTPVSEEIIAEKAAAGEVWVNSNSKVFHKPGTTYYGKTKKGFFMTEAEAIEKGYRGVEGQ